MSRASYIRVLEGALAPMGFERRDASLPPREKAWVRRRGDFEDYVGLQRNAIAGVTANLATKDLVSEQILHSLNATGVFIWYPYERRIGQLMRTTDVWWKNDTDGPRALAENVLAFGMPFFDSFSTLDDQIERYQQSADVAARLYFLTALHRRNRAGDLDEACRRLSSELARKRHGWTPIFEALNTRLGCSRNQ